MIKKKIFISYSWDSEAHKSWVKRLADEIESYKEFHVILDQYDLDHKSDRFHFMENGISSADYIIIVSTTAYCEKSNTRKSGVGIEAKMSSSLHFMRYDINNGSPILIALREGNDVPNYLREKIYIDFRVDNNFQAALGVLIGQLNDSIRAKRPEKKLTIIQKEKPPVRELTRAEDFLKINHKKRELYIEKEKCTDYSMGSKIKFELWKVQTPAPAYFLILFDNASIKQTIERLSLLLKAEKKTEIRYLTVLRSSKGDKGYLNKIFRENDLNIDINEVTFSDYIWEYCIDDSAKQIRPIYKSKFFIDQPLSLDNKSGNIIGPACDFLVKELNSDTQSSAYIIVAAGGTGKTTLCQYIINSFQTTGNTIPVFIQSEELKKESFNETRTIKKISCIYDLYDLYMQSISSKHEDMIIFDKETFESSILTGRIILVIDGMDEIISLFPDQFDLKSFLESIDELSKQLLSCRIIITTRNDVFDLKMTAQCEALKKYYLLGFDEIACSQYLNKRFKNSIHKESIIKKINSHLAPLISRDENNRILPFIIDLLSSLAEDTENAHSFEFDLSFNGKKYESNEEITDYLVYSVLRREYERQNLHVPIEEILEVFLEISALHSENFTKNEFIELVTANFGEESDILASKLLRNPLVYAEGELCRFRYDFIYDYFRTLYIIKCINSNSKSKIFYLTLAKNLHNDGEVFSGLVKYYNSRIDFYIEKSSEIIKSISVAKKSDSEKTELLYKSSAFIIRILSKLNGITNSKESFRNYLSKIFGSTLEIDELFIYGDLPALDFHELTISNSRFVGYKNFQRSRFLNSKFINCHFDSCFNGNVTSISEGFSSSMFIDCRIGDLDNAISGIEQLNNEERAVVERELRSFLGCFFYRGNFTDRKIQFIKMSTKVKSINTQFVYTLVKEEILKVKVEKSDETYYIISKTYEDSVYGFINNNKVDKKIEKILTLIK